MGKRLGISAEFIKPGRVGGIEQALQYTVDGLLESIQPDDSLVIFGDGLPHIASERLEVVVPNQHSSSRFSQETATFKTYGSSIDSWFSPNYFTPRGSWGCVKVTTVPDLQYLHYPDNFSVQKRAWLRWAHDRTLRRADRVTVYSDFVRDDITERYGARWSEQVVTIPIPVSWVRFGEGSGQRRERPYVLAVSSHYKHKNLATLVTSFAAVHREYPDLQLVLVGQLGANLVGVRQVEDVAALVESLGLADVVVPTGYISVEELGDLYRGAELFVHPSLFEGFGLPPVEALGFGLPVIVSNRASLPEVTRGLAQLIDDPLDPEAWTATILETISSPQRPDAAEVERFREHYRPARIAQMLYSELVP